MKNNNINTEEKKKNKILMFMLFYLLPFFFILLVFINFILSETPNQAFRWLTIADLQIINKDILKSHYAALIGLPLAAIFSLWVVVILRNKSGPIEFEFISLKFKGASGQVILWILCFLTITAAIKFVW